MPRHLVGSTVHSFHMGQSVAVTEPGATILFLLRTTQDLRVFALGRSSETGSPSPLSPHSDLPGLQELVGSQGWLV